ncbi:MAG: hypothetical protein V1724_09845 [Chloroflexota bacterium]
MQQLNQETIGQPSMPRLELLRQWFAANRVPATAFAIVTAILLLAFGYLAYSTVGESSRQTELQNRIERLGSIAAISPQQLAEVTKENQRIPASMPAGDLKETDVYRAVLDLAAPGGNCAAVPGGMDVQITYHGETPAKVGNTMSSSRENVRVKCRAILSVHQCFPVHGADA